MFDTSVADMQSLLIANSGSPQRLRIQDVRKAGGDARQSGFQGCIMITVMRLAYIFFEILGLCQSKAEETKKGNTPHDDVRSEVQVKQMETNNEILSPSQISQL